MNLKNDMHKKSSITRISQLTKGNKINLPEIPGVYAFWWMGEKTMLMERTRKIILKGPKGEPVTVIYEDWWPDDLDFPCLYIGKSTNIKKRFGLHIKRGSPRQLHKPRSNNHKVEPVTTTCQLRHGIEHVFGNEQEPLKLINNFVGFSCWTGFSRNPVAERFFEEDRLIGNWRPWFNIDSER